MSISDDILMAYLDNELSPEKRHLIDSALADADSWSGQK